MRHLIAALIALLLVANASADHEPNHRYNVRGYVLDDEEQPIAGLMVQVSSEGKVLSIGRTDDEGFYSVHLHLHNADLSRLLTLQTGKQKAEIRVTFDPRDQTSPRLHDANFVAGKLIEKKLGGFHVSPLAYVALGVFFLIAVAIVLERRRKKKQREALAT